MSQRVYKYLLPLTPGFDQATPIQVTMPKHAKVLKTEFVIPNRRPDPGEGPPLFLWALVDTDDTAVRRDFYVMGTGRDIPDAHLTYLGTAFCKPTEEVFHVFEKTAPAS